MLTVPKPASPAWAMLLIWVGLVVVLVLHMAGPYLPPALTVALFAALALHC